MKRYIILGFSLFTFHFSFSQSWLWGRYGRGDAYVGNVATDYKGNCYLAGLFPNDTIHFGSFTLMNSTVTNAPYSNYFDAFLVKFDYKGNVLWAKQTVNEDTSKKGFNWAPATIADDNKGNTYLNSNFPDSLYVGANTLVNNIGYSSTCVAKYDQTGNVVWVRKSDNTNDSSDVAGGYISCDAYGNIFVSGAFWDTVSFGASKLYSHYANLPFAFLVKYDSSGNVKWARQTRGNTISGAANFCNTNDRFGNSFMTGDFGDTLIVGSYKLSSPYGAYSHAGGVFYLAKYDSMGNVLWAKQAIIPSKYSGCSGWALAADQSGNIYTGGDFIDTAIFDKDTLIGPQDFQSQSSFFLVKYDANGNELWVKQATVLDSNSWSAWSLSIDNSKHLYLSANGGYGKCKVAFGGDTLSMDDTAKYDGASIILKLDSNGKALCSSIILVGSLGGVTNSIASDTSGKYVYFGAAAATPVIFGKDTVNPFAYPINAIQKENYFPFVARWEACDSSIYANVVENKNPVAQVTLYPNPNKGTFTISLQNVNELAQVEIYNVLGVEIYQTKISTDKMEINLGTQPQGVYFYRVLKETGGLVGEGKVIIQK